MIASSVLEMIGNTPLVALDRLHTGPGRLLAKAEYLLPGGSIKDRAARQIILAARERQELKPGQPVVEMTSGNMGSGLAVVCAALGHPFIATMSAGNSPQRSWMLEALGTRVVRVPQVDGSPGQVTGPDIEAAAQQAQRIAREQGAFYVDQFNRIDSIIAHRDQTGAEILRQTGRVDGFAACVGTGHTFAGIAQALKAANPATVCAAVEPAGAQVLAGREVTKPRHVIQGCGYGLVPPHWQPELADELSAVSDQEVLATTQALNEREGLHVGYSSGANVAAARRLLTSGRLGPGAVVVTVLCDSGLKYGQ